MLLINKSDKTLKSLDRKTMREAGYWERRDLQQIICRSPDAFCAELGERVCIVGSDTQATDFVQDRIDLLGVDESGAAVVIELKRDSHKLQLLQALSYAGMIAKWEPKQFIDSFMEFRDRWRLAPSPGSPSPEDLREELEEFLQDDDITAINREQRVILLAEQFDYEVLVTCEWLTERYDVDIRCYRLALAQHGDDLFLSCSSAYPPPELTDIATRRRRKIVTGDGARPVEWSEAKKGIKNQDISAFFDREIENGRRFDPKYRRLWFAIGDRQRFIVAAKRQFARVRQAGRFEKDIDFWASRLSPKGDVQPISHGTELRFYLSTRDNIDKFKRAVESELADVTFSREPDADEQESGELDSDKHA